MDAKSAKKDRRPAEDASTMPLLNLAGRLEDAEVRGLAERLGRNQDMQRKWGQYLNYRRDRGLPCTVRALKGHLESIAQLHPNPQEAYHSLHWTMTREWEFPQPMPKSQPRRPLPGHKAALEAAGVTVTQGAAPSEADLIALQEYKDLAETMNPADRAALLKKCSDTLPALAGSLAARIAILNQRDGRASSGLLTGTVRFDEITNAMRAERAETNPREWHNRLQHGAGS